MRSRKAIHVNAYWILNCLLHIHLQEQMIPFRLCPSKRTSLGFGTKHQYFQKSSTVANSQTSLIEFEKPSAAVLLLCSHRTHTCWRGWVMVSVVQSITVLRNIVSRFNKERFSHWYMGKACQIRNQVPCCGCSLRGNAICWREMNGMEEGEC